MLKMIRPSEQIYKVTVEFDAEAEMYVAYSDDIPGLATEAKTIPDLVKRVLAIAPELLELNDGQLRPEYLAFEQEAIYVPYIEGNKVCA